MDKPTTIETTSPMYNNVAPPTDTPAATALGDGLLKALPIGLVRGLVVLVGHDDPATGHDANLGRLARDIIRHDLLVLATGSAAKELDLEGLTEAAGLEDAGAGLAQFCAYCDVPPVLPAGEGTSQGPVLGLCIRLSGGLGARMADLEKQIHTLAGHEFNVASPAQLGKAPLQRRLASSCSQDSSKDMSPTEVPANSTSTFSGVLSGNAAPVAEEAPPPSANTKKKQFFKKSKNDDMDT